MEKFKEIMKKISPIDFKCPENPKDRINLFCLDENGKNYFI